MSITDSLVKRRSYYKIDKNLPVSTDEVIKTIEKLTELVPDAFNMKSARVIVALNDKQDKLWDTIYDAFGGKVAREKIDSFKSGAGTILYYYDNKVVENMQKIFPTYAANFPVWANQANGMLQIAIWSALRELNIGANIQHYNPIIDEAIKKLFNIPDSYVLIAQMPFGGIVEEPNPKDKENISLRVDIREPPTTKVEGF